MKEGLLEKKGGEFTLIELLVIIAVITILLSILIPAMQMIWQMDRESACKSDSRSVGLALQMYLDDYRTAGRANVLWLDGHVSSLEETTEDDVPLRWYTSDKP